MNGMHGIIRTSGMKGMRGMNGMNRMSRFKERQAHAAGIVDLLQERQAHA